MEEQGLNLFNVTKYMDVNMPEWQLQMPGDLFKPLSRSWQHWAAGKCISGFSHDLIFSNVYTEIILGNLLYKHKCMLVTWVFQFSALEAFLACPNSKHRWFQISWEYIGFKIIQPIPRALLCTPSSIFSPSHWELIFCIAQAHHTDFLPQLWICMFLLILSLISFDSFCIYKIDHFCPSTQAIFSFRSLLYLSYCDIILAFLQPSLLSQKWQSPSPASYIFKANTKFLLWCLHPTLPRLPRNTHTCAVTHWMLHECCPRDKLVSWWYHWQQRTCSCGAETLKTSELIGSNWLFVLCRAHRAAESSFVGGLLGTIAVWKK